MDRVDRDDLAATADRLRSIVESNGHDAHAEAPRFLLRTAADLTTRPTMEWCVKGLLPARGIAALFGPTMSGKSFLTIDLAIAICEGGNWFKHRVKPRRVVYLALEGAAGFGQRLSAWEHHHERPIPDGLQFITEPVVLVDDVVKLIASVVPLGLEIVVIIDTLNAATPGTDENASRDMGLVIEAAKLLALSVEGLVLLVAHTGKDEDRGLRGHSSQFAALDGAIQTARNGNQRTWQAAKVKDGRDGDLHVFRLHEVDLGTDEDGDAITSCVIEVDDDAALLPERAQARGANQKIVIKALAPLFMASHTFGKATAPPHRPCIELEAAINHTCDFMTCEPDRRRERARAAINALTGNAVLSCRDGWVWMP